jgi:hypothetical protein
MREFIRQLNKKMKRKKRRMVDLSPEERRRAKAMLLGAGAGYAMRPDSDGMIRIESISAKGNPEAAGH